MITNTIMTLLLETRGKSMHCVKVTDSENEKYLQLASSESFTNIKAFKI